VETDVYPEAVWEVGGATALFVAGFGAVGYATRRDLSALARVLLWALIALIAFGVVLISVSIPGGSLVYAVFGLAVFAGLVRYDFRRLRVTTRSTARRCWRHRSSSTSSPSLSSSWLSVLPGSPVGGAVDGSDRATDVPILITGRNDP
jgi:FtsH-binding integral membrane protein